jgi:hypothetical protein
MGHRVVLSMGQTDLENQPFFGNFRKRRSHSDHGRPHRLSAAPLGSRRQQDCPKPARLHQTHPDEPYASANNRRTPTTTITIAASTTASQIRLRCSRHPSGPTSPRKSCLCRHGEGGMKAQTVPDTSGTRPGMTTERLCVNPSGIGFNGSLRPRRRTLRSAFRLCRPAPSRRLRRCYRRRNPRSAP